MPRKFINRKFEPKHFDDSEWDHIVESSPKVEIKDALDVQDRSIFLNTDQEQQKTNLEKTKDGVRGAMDRAGNVGQYIKYVNEHLEKKNSEIDRVKKLKEKFDDEVNLLKNDHFPRNNNLTDHLNNKNQLIELRNSLVAENSLTRIYFNKLKEEVWKTESEIQKQQKEITELNEKIKQADFDEERTKKSFDVIKNEVMALGKKYDVKTLNEILSSLEVSLKKSEQESLQREI